MQIDLSIIIPTLNEEKYLPKLLKSILEQSYSGKLEIIVVDGESSDATVATAEAFAQKLPIRIAQTERGVSRQRNHGAELANYDNLLFIDADVILSKGLLNKLSRKLQPKQLFIAQVTHLSTDKLRFLDVPFLLLVHGLLLLAWLGRAPALNGDFILTNKLTHASVGGFAEGTVMAEDTFYGLQAFRKGAKYRFYPWLYLYVSPRRVREIGRWKLLQLWSRGFLYARKHGPIYPDSDIKYPFGQHS